MAEVAAVVDDHYTLPKQIVGTLARAAASGVTVRYNAAGGERVLFGDGVRIGVPASIL